MSRKRAASAGPLEIARRLAAALDDKKAADIAVIKVSKFTIIADYFVLATGVSDTHRRTLVAAAEKKLRGDLGVAPRGVDGRSSGAWTAVDYGGVMLHVMSPAFRAEVGMEKLYHGARFIGTTPRVRRRARHKL